MRSISAALPTVAAPAQLELIRPPDKFTPFTVTSVYIRRVSANTGPAFQSNHPTREQNMPKNVLLSTHANTMTDINRGITARSCSLTLFDHLVGKSTVTEKIAFTAIMFTAPLNPTNRSVGAASPEWHQSQPRA